MKNEKQTTLNAGVTPPMIPYREKCTTTSNKVCNLDDIDIVTADGAVINIRNEGDAAILFYNSPLVKEDPSLVRCLVEIRLPKSVLLDFVEDLSLKTMAFLMEKRKDSDSSIGGALELMFG